MKMCENLKRFMNNAEHLWQSKKINENQEKPKSTKIHEDLKKPNESMEIIEKYENL